MRSSRMVRSVFPGAAWLLVAASAWAADGAAPDNARAMLLAGVGRACLAAKTPADLETLAVKQPRAVAALIDAYQHEVLGLPAKN